MAIFSFDLNMFVRFFLHNSNMISCAQCKHWLQIHMILIMRSTTN